MIIETGLSPSVWIVWLIIGIIGGYMTGRLLPYGAPTWLTLLIGITASCGGGWIYTYFFGTSDNEIYLSLVSSAIITSLAMWLTYTVSRRRGGPGPDDD